MPVPVLRPSAAAETVKSLREAIRTGEYGRELPSERLLSEALNVSRRTVRGALRQLERDDLIEKRNRRPCRVRRKTTGRPRTRRGLRWLQLDTRVFGAIECGSTYAYLVEHLASAGVELLVETLPVEQARPGSPVLERLLDRAPRDLWILVACPGPVQQAFHERGVSCVSLLSTCAETDFPSLDLDYPAIGRHAAGMLLSRGHRSLALLQPHNLLDMDVKTMAGFREAVAGSGRADVTVTAVRIDVNRPGSVHHAADRLLRCPARPDGWFLMKGRDYIASAMYLLYRGIAVGSDISLVSRQRREFQGLVPSPAHYVPDEGGFNRRLLRMVQRRLARHDSGGRRTLIEARFVDGTSLRRHGNAGRSEG